MGDKYTFDQLDELGFEYGIEVEEADEEVVEKEEDKEKTVLKSFWKFECQNNRPDLLTELALTRILKIYMNKMETPVMKLSKPTTSITVDPSVNFK